jgi:hypothetical protein
MNNRLHLIALIVFGSIFVQACQRSSMGRVNHDPKYICIGTISPKDQEALSIIESLLKKMDIKYYSEGSIMYGLYVEEEKKNEAIRLLLSDERLKRRWQVVTDIGQ